MNSCGQTLYIQLSPAALANRLENAKTQRPVLQGKKGDELAAFIEEKLAEREEFYLKAYLYHKWYRYEYRKLAETLGLPLK